MIFILFHCGQKEGTEPQTYTQTFNTGLKAGPVHIMKYFFNSGVGLYLAKPCTCFLLYFAVYGRFLAVSLIGLLFVAVYKLFAAACCCFFLVFCLSAFFFNFFWNPTYIIRVHLIRIVSNNDLQIFYIVTDRDIGT